MPPRSEQQPKTTEQQKRTDRTTPSRRAPALAGAALALAVTALAMLFMTIQRGAVAVVARADAGVTGNVEDDIREYGALTPLIVCLITGAAALVVGAFARHDLGARREHYTNQAASGTQTLTSVAKGLAIPTLVLAVLAGIAYLVGSAHW
ncbi:hypothetical protein [Streptomyces luteogriseus]|uniref:hypothetical protein n=1 Tax=Streptomyces luteogriseus TaxID=68233 RepID=UPI0037F1274D